MPPHMLPVLGSSTVVNIVGVCDSILYKAISGVLMPTVLQALPDRWARPSVSPRGWSPVVTVDLIMHCLVVSLTVAINVKLLRIKF